VLQLIFGRLKKEMSLENGDTMRTGKVIRFIDLGSNVQLLCADKAGLLSVYFEHMPFISFYRMIRKAGLKLAGLQIEFNRTMVHVPALDRTCEVCSTPRKTRRNLFCMKVL
jgi:hypothetical protein